MHACHDAKDFLRAPKTTGSCLKADTDHIRSLPERLNATNHIDIETKILICPLESIPPKGKIVEDVENIINLNKYSPASKEFVAKILQAITIFDCYVLKVNEKKPFFTAGSEFVAAAFDALKGLKIIESEYTKTMSACFIQLSVTTKAFRNMTNVVGDLEKVNAPCFIGGNMYTKEDCNECKIATPRFITKLEAKIVMRLDILLMQENIPKQFLYYASDIFIITAEGIRIIDEVWTCLEFKPNPCDTKDKSFAMFTKRMEDIAKKEDEHRKFLVAIKIKIKELFNNVEKKVLNSIKLVKNCLWLRKGINIMNATSGVVDWERVSQMATAAGMFGKNIKMSDTKRVVETKSKKSTRRVGKKLAFAH